LGSQLDERFNSFNALFKCLVLHYPGLRDVYTVMDQWVKAQKGHSTEKQILCQSYRLHLWVTFGQENLGAAQG